MNRASLSLLFLFGALLFVIAPPRPDMTSDSHAYFSAADHILRGDGLYTVTSHAAERAFVVWPPLYPALLAAMGALTGASLARIAVIVNLLAMLLVLGSFARWFRGSLAILATLLFLGSPAFLLSFGMAWTESLFIGFVTVFLWHAAKYMRDASRSALLWMAVCAALAALTRYAGITLIATGLIVTMGRRKFRDSLIFVAIASAPLLLWLARNAALTGTLAGKRQPASHTFTQSLYDTGRGLLEMLAPAVLVIIAVWHRVIVAPYAPIARASVLFAVIYLTFLITTSALFTYDPIGLRLLAPLLPSTALTTVALVGSIHEHRGHDDGSQDE